jgi:hypothetical protein
MKKKIKGHVIYLCIFFLILSRPSFAGPDSSKKTSRESSVINKHVDYKTQAGNTSASQPEQATFANDPSAVLSKPEYVEGEVLVLLEEDIEHAMDDSGAIQDDPGMDDNGFLGIESAIRGKVIQRSVLPRQRRNEKKPDFQDPQLNKKSDRDPIQRKGAVDRRKRRQVLRVQLPEGQSVQEAIKENWKKNDSRIVAVEPNYIVHTMRVPNDPMYNNLYALKDPRLLGDGPVVGHINVEKAWDISTGSEDIVVAVIDSGIDYTHEDLAANMYINSGEIPNNGIDDDRNGYIDDVYGYDFYEYDGDPMDEYNHGTHCAGTIGAVGNNRAGVVGVNWNVKLMAVRFLGPDGIGDISGAIAAINYAVENGADILSNSWGGGGFSQTLLATIENARDHGVLFVAAAGNFINNNDLYPSYPASYNVSNIISVAATDKNDIRADFSNYGKNSVHLGAPGVKILSTVPSGGYEEYSGTSMATPHVAGAAALVRSVFPDISMNELKSRLVYLGDPVDSLIGKTLSGTRLNVYNSMRHNTPFMKAIFPRGGEIFVESFILPIKWVSINGGDTVNIFLLKNGEQYARIAENIPNSGEYLYEIPKRFAGSGYTIRIDDGNLVDESAGSFDIVETFFAEQFNRSNFFDLGNKMITFFPKEGGKAYDAEITSDKVYQFPTNPSGGKTLTLETDDFKRIDLINGTFPFYGKDYASFYVGSNGYITFIGGDNTYSASFDRHFAGPRISALFTDLNPSAGGTVSVKELSDRVVVTWEGVPLFAGRGDVCAKKMGLDGEYFVPAGSALKFFAVNDMSGFDGEITSSLVNGDSLGEIGASFVYHNGTGVFFWVPGHDQKGKHRIIFKLRDGENIIKEKEVTIYVGDNVVDFSKGDLSEWEIVDEGSLNGPSSWRIINGEFVQDRAIYSAGEPRLGTYALYKPSQNLRNYRVNVDIKSTDNDALGVMFRYKDQWNYYRFSMDRERGYRRLMKFVNGIASVIAEDQIKYDIGVWQNLGIEADGDHMTVLLNGRVIFDVNDSTHDQGGIAFYTWSNSGSYFDNLEIIPDFRLKNKYEVIAGDLLTLPLNNVMENGQILNVQATVNGVGLGTVGASIQGDGSGRKSLFWFTKEEQADSYRFVFIFKDGNGKVVRTSEVDIHLRPRSIYMGSGGGFWSSALDAISVPLVWNIFDEGGENAPSNWKVENRILKQTKAIYGTYGNAYYRPGTFALYKGSESLTDYDVSVDVMSTQNDAVGIMFRYKGQNDYYRFSMDRERNYQRLVKKDDGVVSLLAERAVKYTMSQWYNLKIRSEGNRLKVWIDNELIFDVIDDAHERGGVALYSWQNGGVNFKNFVITSLKEDITAIPVEIDSCRLLNEKGRTYVLTQNLTGSQVVDKCLSITAPDVTLDCKGHTISNTSLQGTFVHAGAWRSTVKNCTLVGPTTGTYSGSTGIASYWADYSVIEGNTIRGFGQGINIHANKNVIKNNSVENSIKAISVRLDGNIVRENVVKNNRRSPGWGLTSWEGTNTLFENNISIGNFYGVLLAYADGSIIRGGEYLTNQYYDIYIYNRSRNITIDNVKYGKKYISSDSLVNEQ